MTTKPRTRRTRSPASSQDGKPSARVIRKYPNRRLYDTVESRYVTLADIRRLVVERIDFVVLDRKSQQDITRSILLQVIAEQEGAGESLMSRDFLSQVIRSYGSTMQNLVSGYLEQGMKLLLTQQQQARESFRGATGMDLGAMTEFTERNLNQWRSLQEQWLKQVFGVAGQRPDEPGKS